MTKITEDKVEQFAIDLLEAQGYTYVLGTSIAPDGESPERESFSDVVLQKNAKIKLQDIWKVPDKKEAAEKFN